MMKSVPDTPRHAADTWAVGVEKEGTWESVGKEGVSFTWRLLICCVYSSLFKFF